MTKVGWTVLATGWSRLALGSAFALVVAACVQDPEVEKKPEAPDLSAILDAYRNPTLNLPRDDVDTLIDYAEDAVAQIEALDIENQILDPVYDALELEQEAMNGEGGAQVAPVEARVGSGAGVRASQSVEIEGDGFLRVTRVCAGWEGPIVDEEANGSMHAIVGFTEGGIDPVIWADFEDCKYVTPAGNLHVSTGDGSTERGVALHLDDVSEPEDLRSSPILFVVNLDATISGTTVEARFSFRHDPVAQRLEILYETSSGALVLLVEAKSVVGVRARDGEYTCDIDGQCTN